MKDYKVVATIYLTVNAPNKHEAMNRADELLFSNDHVSFEYDIHDAFDADDD